MNFLYTDTEYSSFYSSDRKKSGELLQLAIIPVVGGVVHPPFNEYCRPLTAKWNPGAEKVHGISRGRAETHQHPSELAKKLMEFIIQYDCIFTCAGWNCRGDISYIERLLTDHNIVVPFYKRVRMKWRDVKDRAKSRERFFPLANYKLGTAADFFKLKFNAHDAVADADMTRQIDERLSTVSLVDVAVQLDTQGMSKVDKRAKYADSGYAHIGQKTVYISEKATSNPEAMRYIIEELWDTFVEGR